MLQTNSLSITFATLLLATPTLAAEPPEDFEFVVAIVVKSDKLTDRELKAANSYARCMSVPYFPIASNFGAQRDMCRTARAVRKPNAELTRVLDQLDHIVSQDPGSEASLKVAKSDAPNS